MSEVAGIELDGLAAPLHDALAAYQELGEGRFRLNLDEAVRLALTPDKPNSARSATAVTTGESDEELAKLYVIAFKPGDATGDESGRSLHSLTVASPYPVEPKIVPRNKTGIHHEVLLTLLCQSLASPQADPEPFAGTFHMLGIERALVKKVGELGHPLDRPAGAHSPLATYTVGQRRARGQGRKIERFGDPHAVYSAVPDALQICAFLAISHDVQVEYPDLLSGLRPRYPRPPFIYD
jgi:hypothetical protein